jgi:hypothetical protein
LPAALVVAALQRQPLKTRPPRRTIFDVMMASRILRGFVRRELLPIVLMLAKKSA